MYRRQQTQPSQRKEKSKKVMWLSEEALQTAKEKREPKKKKAREKGKDISN